MSLFSDFVKKAPPNQKPLIKKLDEIIQQTVPSLQPSLKWGNLTYHNVQNVCAILSDKNHINLQFFSGISLDDPESRLEGTGKTMRYLKIRNDSDIDPDYISNLMQQAAKVDR